MKKSGIINLEKKIVKAAQDYYTGNESMSDKQFDDLVDNLREVDPNNPNLNKVGWGYDITKIKGNKIPHKYGLVGSLKKIHSVSEMPNTFKDDRIMLTAKLDGASCVAYYVNGELDKAVTRGNGSIGLDCTDKFNKIIEKYNINVGDFTGAVRGEIVFSIDSWSQYLNKYPDAKFPRNVATGLFMRDDVSDDLEYVHFVTYKVEGVENHKEDFKTYDNVLAKLYKWGFEITQSILTNRIIMTDEYMKDIYSSFNKYPTDGIVIQNDDITINEDNSVTYTNIAYKFKAEEKVTEVKNITWAMSKNNIIVPVVNVNPVELSGAIVSKTSGFNYKYIIENKVGPGAIVKMMRSGEVIPHITEILRPSNNVEYPKVCKYCGHLLEEDGVELRCNNIECPNIERSRFIEWITVVGIRDILGIGPAIIDQFIDNFSIIKARYSSLPLNYLDLYNEDYGVKNENIKNEVCAMFTPAISEKIRDMINNLAQPIEVDKLIMALNIQNIGPVICQKIGKYVYKAVTENKINELTSIKNIKGLGEEVYKRIYNSYMLLQNAFSVTQVTVKEDKQIFMQITITGPLSVPREKFESVCNDYGIFVSENVKTSKYLITNNPNSGSGKLQKAAKYNIEIISEKDFVDKYFKDCTKNN